MPVVSRGGVDFGKILLAQETRRARCAADLQRGGLQRDVDRLNAGSEERPRPWRPSRAQGQRRPRQPRLVDCRRARQDRDTIRSLTTPEMAGYFAEELAANARKGLRNEVSEVKFLQGDLSEAWREEAAEYATVAMRFSLIDKMADPWACGPSSDTVQSVDSSASRFIQNLNRLVKIVSRGNARTQMRLSAACELF